MLNQDLSKVLAGHISRYSLVTATAKRAREISNKNLEDKVITTDKAVSLALNDLLEDKYRIVEPEEIAHI
ncbi:MAG: DNA-directed RNA polymerase subunit omega [Ruminococcaceae bacterium]|nr:DNA-directed RNA polymerase subunit omega [Oscillospiraceae bacterium]